MTALVSLTRPVGSGLRAVGLVGINGWANRVHDSKRGFCSVTETLARRQLTNANPAHPGLVLAFAPPCALTGRQGVLNTGILTTGTGSSGFTAVGLGLDSFGSSVCPQVTVVSTTSTQKRLFSGRRWQETPQHYKTLGVSEAATPEQIRKAFQEKAKQTHPDGQGRKSKKGASAEENRDTSEFRILMEAYRILKNEDLRAKYDDHIRFGIPFDEKADSSASSSSSSGSPSGPSASSSSSSSSSSTDSSGFHSKARSNYSSTASSTPDEKANAHKSGFRTQNPKYYEADPGGYYTQDAQKAREFYEHNFSKEWGDRTEDAKKEEAEDAKKETWWEYLKKWSFVDVLRVSIMFGPPYVMYQGYQDVKRFRKMKDDEELEAKRGEYDKAAAIPIRDEVLVRAWFNPIVKSYERLQEPWHNPPALADLVQHYRAQGHYLKDMRDSVRGAPRYFKTAEVPISASCLPQSLYFDSNLNQHINVYEDNPRGPDPVIAHHQIEQGRQDCPVQF